MFVYKTIYTQLHSIYNCYIHVVAYCHTSAILVDFGTNRYCFSMNTFYFKKDKNILIL